MSFHVEIIAVGKLKASSPFHSLFENYTRRLQGSFKLIELEGQSQAEEHQKIAAKLNSGSALIALDETGKYIGRNQF